MFRLFAVALVAACLSTLTLAAGPALAESAATKDCYAHNKLTRHYSVSELRTAMATMPADVKEYTSCYQVEQDQLFRQLHQPVPGQQPGSGGRSGGSFISTPLLVVLIVVVLAGGGLAFVAARRGGGGGTPPTAAAG
jgi:hypothetical protein